MSKRLWHSAAFRLALLSGVLVIISVTAFAAVFYIGTIHSLEKRINQKIQLLTGRLLDEYEKNGLQAVERGINYYLNDGVDFDTETFLLTDSRGRELAGNLSSWNDLTAGPFDRVLDREVFRYGLPTNARVVLHKLPEGAILVVGRDMKNVNTIIQRLWRTMAAGCLLGLILAIGGTIFFRNQLQERLGAIRQTIETVKAGDLATRIPVPESEDEFARLSIEMNGMFDKIEHLMEGVRHVSNTIAHNLRTPLGRIRGHLDEALRENPERTALAEAAEFSLIQLDALTVVLNKLLQIAEAESGTRRQPFASVAVRDIVTDVVELYDAVAEDQGITIRTRIEGDPRTVGDRDLLASALANLLDNALKYGGNAVTIDVHAVPQAGSVTLVVEDNGPGIPAEERSKVVKRFYRLDQKIPGTGLGLSIVTAIAHLHGTTLQFEDAAPGLRTRMDLPLAAPA